MESNKELKISKKKSSKQPMESTVETVQQVASEELDKAKARFVGGRSIDRGNPEDENQLIQSDDEGMIEEIVTTVEEDKDLECKVKKKIETKKTIAQDPETHNTITKVVKTEVTEITRTITINDQHDLERAKRELGIDDVNQLLPSTQIIYNLPSTYHSASSWIDHPRLTHVQEKYYEPANEIVTSGDFPSDSPVKQHSPAVEPTTDQPLADATTVGRGEVVESIISSPPVASVTTTETSNQPKSSVEKKKKKKSSLNLCSCTRSQTNDYDEEQRKQKAATIIEQKSKQKKKASMPTTTNVLLPSSNETIVNSSTPVETQNQGQKLISAEIKQLIEEKKSLIIEYIHSKVFLPGKLFTSTDQDVHGRKISSRLLDLLHYDRCSSWQHLYEQVKDEYTDQFQGDNSFLHPMIKTYEDLFTHKQSNLLNTFSTIHHEKDVKNLPENYDYITIVQTYLNEGENQTNVGIITKPFVENVDETLQRLQHHAQSEQKVMDDDQEKQQPLVLTKDIDMSDDIEKALPIYNEEQLNKMLANISQDRPITLAEAIAYQYIDLEDPKLALSNDTAKLMKNLFRPLPQGDESSLNLIRINRSGKHLTDFNLAESNPLEKLHFSEPWIYQLQQTFEPTLDFNEKQFRSLTETILTHKNEYSQLQFDIGRTLIPAGDLKESSTNDFSQSDSGYSMTTTTHESLASKLKNEFETINEPTVDPLDETTKSFYRPQLSLETDVERTQIKDQAITSNSEVKKDSTSPSTVVNNENVSPTPAHVKKRKSSGLLSCFGNKKSKASTEQQGRPTLAPVNETNLPTSSSCSGPVPLTISIQTELPPEKSPTDYAILPDGKRIYIDTFRDRPGLDMSYQPNDFDTRFALPVTKTPSEHERSITPEIPVVPATHLESRSTTIDSTDIVEDQSTVVHLETQSPVVEPTEVKLDEHPIVHLEPRAPIMDPVDPQADLTENHSVTHLEARPATIEHVDIQSEPTPVVVSSSKHEGSTIPKPIADLHGAGVTLPKVELVEPGPLPTLSLSKEKTKKKSKEVVTTEKPAKVKKSSVGLCASCFGAKAAAKKKKEASETVKAPIEQEKKDEIPVIVTPLVEQTTVEIVETTPTIIVETAPEVLPSSEETSIVVPQVEVEPVLQAAEEISKPDDRLGATIENLVATEEPHYQLPSSEPVPQLPIENEYSLADSNTYDIPRPIETSNILIDTEEKIVSKDIDLTPITSDIKSVTSDLMASKDVEDKPQIQSIMITNNETMPNVDIKETSSKGSYTLPTKKSKNKKEKQPKVKKEKSPKVKKEKEVKTDKEKKSGLFSSVFRSSDRKSKTPALDLPPVDRELTANNQPRDIQLNETNPLQVPNNDLPQLNVSLPNFDRPEAKLTTGQWKQSSEFSVPSVDLPPIPDLPLPQNDQQTIDFNSNTMKIPSVELPEVQYASNETTKLPEIHFETTKKETLVEIPIVKAVEEEKPIEHPTTLEAGLALASPVDDLMGIQVNHKEFPIETDYAVQLDQSEIVIKPELLSTEQKYTIADAHFVSPPELPSFSEKQVIEHQESVPPLPDLATPVPSFENDATQVIEVETTSGKSNEKQKIESKSVTKKKSSTLALCSCFGTKSAAEKEKSKTLITPAKVELPAVDMPVPESNISSTLKTKGPLRAPSNDLPPVVYNDQPTEPVRLPSFTASEKKRPAPKKPTPTDDKPMSTTPEVIIPTITTIDVSPVEEEMLITPTPMTTFEKDVNEEIQLKPTSPTPVLDNQGQVEQTQIRSTTPPPVIDQQTIVEKESTLVESKKSSSFEIKAPALHFANLDLTGPPRSDAYISSIKSDESVSNIAPIQSRSDSGLEAIISSHLQPSSTNATLEDLHQHTSISSGLGSEILDSINTKGYTLSDSQQEKTTISTVPKRENSLLRHDFTRKISMNDESRSKLLFCQDELKKCLENEIAQSIDDFDSKKDQKNLQKILSHAIDLIKDKKVSTYPELKQKLIMEHKNEAFIVDPVVRSLYCTMEKQGLDNISKPEFPLAIRDMVRLPAKQALDTVTQLDKESRRISETTPSRSSWLNCGRTKSKKASTTPKPTTTTTNTGLLDERRRLQLHTHRQELGTILRDHIQSSQPPIRHVVEHPREMEKIIRKSLHLVSQPKILSYEQIRNDLKTEFKQTFFLIDPTIDIVRDTFDHCDITQINEKTNLDILDGNISQTAQLYNQVTQQSNLLTNEELNNFKSNNLTWLNSYLIENQSKTTRKQNKELNKILSRALNILSLNLLYTWDELNSQLRREFAKAHDLCDRAVELIKQAQKDGLLLATQSPSAAEQDVTSINIIQSNGKRRISSLITDRARTNLKSNRTKIVASMIKILHEHNKPLYTENQIETYLNKTFQHLEQQKSGQFKDYNDLKNKLKKDFKSNHENLIEQIVDIVEQAHATNQFDDVDKIEVQTLMKDRLNGKPLVIKEVYVSLPPRSGAYGTSKNSNDDSGNHLSTSINGDRTMNSSTSSHRVARGLSWREANERARILFYRGKHPAIHYDEQAAGFDVRMLLETTSGGTQEIPVTDSDVHELLNSCGVQWDGVNIISLVDHSEDVVRAAEQAALKVIREKGLVDVRTPPAQRTSNDNDEPPTTS